MIEILVGDRNAVQEVHVVSGPLPCNENRWTSLRQRRAPGSARRDENVVAQKRKIHKLAAIQRQRIDAGIIDDFADFRIRGLEPCSRLFDRDGLINIADFQNEIHGGLRSYLQNDTLPDLGCEIRQFGLDRVLADRQRGSGVISVAVRFDLTFLSGRLMLDCQ